MSSNSKFSSARSLSACIAWALCCATAYGNPDLHLLALFGIAACAVGLAFALLTNWQILKPEIASLLRLRVAFLSVPMALAGTTLMMRVSAASDIVKISRAATIFMIWATTSLLNLLMFSLGSGLQDKAFSLKLLAVTSILGLLGVIATPILKKVFPS